MNICLIWKIILCGLLYVFQVYIKGHQCECSHQIGRACISCDVGCYLVTNTWCYKCRPNCSSCTSKLYCDVCKSGYRGPSCDFDCFSCRDGACTNNTCTDDCADGYYHHEEDGGCRRCPNTCVTCKSNYECTLCVAGRTGYYCQHCTPGYYLDDGQCNQCNTNCLHDTCYDNGGECTNGCKDGWTGWECNDTCGPKCVSCDRHNETACTSCKPGYYGPSCYNECHHQLCSQDGGTQDTQSSDNVFVILGAVGSAVMIISIISAVWVSISHRKRRRNEADPERSVTHENSPLYNGPSNVCVTDTIRITEYTVHDIASTPSLGTVPNIEDLFTDLNPSQEPIYEELDTNDDVDVGDILGPGPVTNGQDTYTDSNAHSTLPRLTPSNGPVNDGDVIHGNVEDVPVIFSGLGVAEPEDNVEELREDEVYFRDQKDADTPDAEKYYNINGLTRTRVQVDTLMEHVTSISTKDSEKEFNKLPKGLTRPYGDAVKPTNVSKNRYKAHNTTTTPSLGPDPNIEAHYTALISSQGPVYEELDKNDDLDVGDKQAHYTALTPSQGPVYEELNKNDDVDDGDIKGVN